MTRDLTPLFFPRSVAVIGASPRPQSLAGAVIRNLVAGGFSGDLAAVHPDGAPILGAVTVRDMSTLPFVPDLAIWGVPFEAMDRDLPRVLDQGTRAHVILTAGFSETGSEGAARERSLAARVHDRGGVVLGPNCLGLHVARPDSRLDASFSRARPAPGNIALLTQSGSVAEWLLIRLAERGLGVTLTVSAGNMADLDLVDLLEAIPGHFPELRRVLLYMETIPEAARLRVAVDALPPEVQVLALLGGTTAGGVRAVAGHTGALAAEPALAAALLDAVGIVRVDGLSHALDTLEVLGRLDPPRGRRAVIVTNAGAPAVLLADALDCAGFTLPVLPITLQSELRKHLPATAVLQNPVDLLATASPALFERCLRLLTSSDDVDLIVPVFMHPVTVDAGDIASAIARGLGSIRTRSAVCWLAGSDAADALTALRAQRIAAVTEPGPLAAALATWANMARETGKRWPPDPPPGEDPTLEMRTLPGELDMADALGRVGAPGTPPTAPGSRLLWGDPETLEAALESPLHRIPPQLRVLSPADVPDAVRRVGFPCVLKLESTRHPHKRASGLFAYVDAEADLGPALESMRTNAPPNAARWLVQRRLHPGVEVYVGFLRHPRWGPFLGFAPGGTGVEVRSRASWMALPTWERDVGTAIRNSPLTAVLGGPVSSPNANSSGIPERRAVAELYSLLESLASVGLASTDVTMAEVNPAIWDPEPGCYWLVDCRWTLASGTP